MSTHAPKTLLEATRYFSDPDRCVQFVAAMRWPNGPECPHCRSHNVGFLSTRRIYKCREKECRKQFSVKVGTVMEDSAVPLDKWLVAIWLIANAKNGISSYELGRSLGVTQKSAWFMNHRIRLAMHNKSLDKKLSGEVEANETFIGGKARNMHLGKRLVKMANGNGKTAVMGLLERHGEVRTKVISAPSAKELHRGVRQHVEPGANLFTDECAGYKGLSGEYVHKVINHAECYAKGNIHTNGLENYWSLVKRTIMGTYVSVEPWHLFRYLDEQAFRYNARKGDDRKRFLKVCGTLAGRRLTYEKLTGKWADGLGLPKTGSR